jgi:hypothetical protein
LVCLCWGFFFLSDFARDAAPVRALTQSIGHEYNGYGEDPLCVDVFLWLAVDSSISSRNTHTQGRRTSARIQKQQTKHAIFADPDTTASSTHTSASVDAMACERALCEGEVRPTKRVRRGLHKPTTFSDSLPDPLHETGARPAPSPPSHGKPPRGANRRSQKALRAGPASMPVARKPYSQMHVDPVLPVAASPAVPSVRH